MGDDHAAMLSDLGRNNDTIARLLSSLSSQPDDPHLLVQLSWAFYRVEDYQQALFYAQNAVGLAPELESAHLVRSVCLVQLKRFKEAMASATESARLAPQSASALLTLGEAQLAMGDRTGAITTAKRVLLVGSERADAHDFGGRVLLRFGRPEEAERRFREALRIEPMSSVSMNNLAVAMQKQRRHGEAVSTFKQAAQMSPTSPLYQSNLRGATDKYLSIYAHIPPVVRILVLLAFLWAFRPYGWFVFLSVAGVTWLIRKQRLDPTVRTFYDSRMARPRVRWRPILVSIGALVFVGFAEVVILSAATAGVISKSVAPSLVLGVFLLTGIAVVVYLLRALRR